MKYDSSLKVTVVCHPGLKGLLTSDRCFIAREFGESSQMGKQMTVPATGAPIGKAKSWASINWNTARAIVRRLQMRIAKAISKKPKIAYIR